MIQATLRKLVALGVVMLALVVVTVTAHAGNKAAIKKLAQARVDAAAKVYASTETRWKAGAATADAVAEWSVRWLDAERDQPLTGKALTAAIDDHLARMQAFQSEVAAQSQVGTVSQGDVDVAAYYETEAELWSARAHGKP